MGRVAEYRLLLQEGTWCLVGAISRGDDFWELGNLSRFARYGTAGSVLYSMGFGKKNERGYLILRSATIRRFPK